VRLGKARVAARFDGAVGQLLRGLARAQAVLSKIAFATGKCRTLSQTAVPKTPSANIAQSQENQFEGRSSNSAAPGEQDLRSVWRSRCAD
jgi:hypothetical protein